MSKDASGKKQLLVSIKAEGKLLKKRLDSFLKSLVDNDVYDIKKNKDLSGLTSIELAQMMKFASDAAEGKLSDVISTYSGMDDAKKSVLPDRINELMADIEESEKVEEEAPPEEPKAADSAPAPESEETEVPPPLPGADADAPAAGAAEESEKDETKMKESAGDWPALTTVRVKGARRPGESDVIAALEDEYGGMVSSVEDWEVLKSNGPMDHIVKAIGIVWSDDMDEGYMKESDGETPAQTATIDKLKASGFSFTRWSHADSDMNGGPTAMLQRRRGGSMSVAEVTPDGRVNDQSLSAFLADLNESAMMEALGEDPINKEDYSQLLKEIEELMVNKYTDLIKNDFEIAEAFETIVKALNDRIHDMYEESSEESQMNEGVYSYGDLYLKMLKGA
jgi:hypothetical protein